MCKRILEAVKEDLSKLRSDIADLTQKLLDMGKSEAGSASWAASG
jgi:hypothetical protein